MNEKRIEELEEKLIAMELKANVLTNKLEDINKYIQSVFISQEIRRLKEYKFWKQGVNKKDNGSCVVCNSKENLEYHHIFPFHKILEDYNISSIEEALKCPILWDINNGLTLCKEHHAIFKNKGGKLENGYALIGNDISNLEVLPLNNIIHKEDKKALSDFDLIKMCKSIKKSLREKGFTYFNQYLSIDLLLCFYKHHNISDNLFITDFDKINNKIGKTDFYIRFIETNHKNFIKSNFENKVVFIDKINKIFLEGFNNEKV
jgi:hypothetical protein